MSETLRVRYDRVESGAQEHRMFEEGAQSFLKHPQEAGTLGLKAGFLEVAAP